MTRRRNQRRKFRSPQFVNALQKMKTIFFAILFQLAVVQLTEAGVRCSLGGDKGCTLGCVALGQTSGICDTDNECWCSEKSITYEVFRELLPSRCTMGLEFCQKTCHSIGRKTGACVTGRGCECSEERLSASEFALCASDSACTVHCQSKGKAGGICEGWDCVCRSFQN